MLKLDIGCGSTPRAGFVGVDIAGTPDVICDVANERLPFENASADHILSSHCLEHIKHDQLLHVLPEMTRVAANGALIEIWHPNVFHSEAFVIGHVNYLSESIYSFTGCLYRSFTTNCWFAGVQWILSEVRYNVEPVVLADMEAAGIDVEFAVSYLRDVIKEMGIFVRIDRTNQVGPNTYGRFICADREHTTLQLADGPRRESRLEALKKEADCRQTAAEAEIRELRGALAASEARIARIEAALAQSASTP
jgi:SAM-dependent methyltransferase